MAATLTDSGELTYVSFPIEKTETTDDGDLIVFGKATDGSVDHDQQVVLPKFAGPAIEKWLETGGNLRVQHSAQRDPAGIGLEVKHDGDATWVRGLVIEPVAKKLVAKGALRAYSVGIARPTIERDPTGKARGGIISGGEIVEISLVDRPANKSCGIQLVKSADDGTPEYVGRVFGADDAIQKALSDADDVLYKTAEPEAAKSIAPAAPADISQFQMPDLNITFTPNDMARMLKQKVVEEHYAGLAAQAAAPDPVLKAVLDAEAGVYKRDIDTATRRRLAADGKALPNLSYPIENAGDLDNAATLARSGHGDVGAARRLIARRAKELGVANPLDDDDKVKKGSSEEEAAIAEPVAEKADSTLDDKAQAVLRAVQDLMLADQSAAKEAEPDVTKACSACAGGDCDGASCSCGKCSGSNCCGKSASKAADPEPKPVKKAKKKAGGKKKLPPWLNSGSDEGGDDEGKGSSGDTGACKMDHAHTEKCKTDPAQAAGVGASPMNPAPVPELLETPPVDSMKAAPTPQSASGASDAPSMDPVPRHREPDGSLNDNFEKDAGMSDGDSEAPTRLEAPMKGAQPEVAALLRFQALGVNPDLGRLHDMTCPAYHPDEVAKYHPYADFKSLIEEGAWQRKALRAAAGPVEAALDMHAVWQAALVLKQADPGVVNDYRLAAFKAFRDANPGPATYPTPGSVSPQKYNRPLITDGHETSSTGHDGPNSSPQVATSAPNASSFDRPPLTAAHQSPSPSFMKQDGEYPSVHGIPVQLSYARDQREQAKFALEQMHQHLASVFPTVCPLDLNQPLGDGHGAGTRHPVPVPAGIGKSIDPEPAPEAAAPDGVFKAPVEEGDLFADADVYKGFKKMRKKLGKKVLSGKMTVDEARSRLGRQFAQKGTEDAADEALGAVQKAAANLASATNGTVTLSAGGVGGVTYGAGGGGTSYTVTSASPAPPVAASFGPDDIEAAVTKAVTPLLEKIREQDEAYTAKLAETQRVIDAIADQPDPSTAAFSGLAFKSVQGRRPAAVTDVAESAARAQDMIRRRLENTYRTHSDPYVREAAGESLAALGVHAPEAS